MKNFYKIFQILSLPIFIGLLMLSTTAQSLNPNLNQEPRNVKFVVSDIENFWRAYDLTQKETIFEKKVEIYQREYLDKGSQGLKEFAALRIGKAKDLAEKIEAMPKFYASIRESSFMVSKMLPKIQKSFVRLLELYPNAVFPDVYFVIGRVSSGGTTWKSGLLIGTEMSCLTVNASQEEFTDWHREVLKPIEKLPGIVAHELIHFQQNTRLNGTLLSQSLNEGGADFVGEMISGLNINEKLYKYGNENEERIWVEFKSEIELRNFDKWLYNGGKIKDRPADLGYFVGFKICESYFRQSKDKKQALADILTIKDAIEFLKQSRYGEKLNYP